MNTDNTELMVVDQQGKAGRPTKYSPETVGRLLAGLADGLSYKSACITAGIGVSTLADWRERYPELEVRMEEAREVARAGCSCVSITLPHHHKRGSQHHVSGCKTSRSLFLTASVRRPRRSTHPKGASSYESSSGI